MGEGRGVSRGGGEGEMVQGSSLKLDTPVLPRIMSKVLKLFCHITAGLSEVCKNHAIMPLSTKVTSSWSVTLWSQHIPSSCLQEEGNTRSGLILD